MELTATDLDDLASFFGRRLDLQLTPVPPPRTQTEAKQRTMAWAMVLEEAQEAGRLSALVHRIASQYPDDATLQSACRLLTDPGRASDRLIGLVLLAGATAFVGAAGVLMGGFSGLVLSMGLPDSGPPPPPVAAAAMIPPAALEEWAVEEEVIHPQRVEVAAPTRCAGEEGKIVGYWYAGANTLERGTVVAMDRKINVRQDYPTKRNGYNLGAHIECVLRPGDYVTVSQNPIPVRGGLYWIPLVSGDLATSWESED